MYHRTDTGVRYSGEQGPVGVHALTNLLQKKLRAAHDTQGACLFLTMNANAHIELNNFTVIVQQSSMQSY